MASSACIHGVEARMGSFHTHKINTQMNVCMSMRIRDNKRRIKVDHCMCCTCICYIHTELLDLDELKPV